MFELQLWLISRKIKFVGDLRQISGFLRHNIIEILLKSALSTIKQKQISQKTLRSIVFQLTYENDDNIG